MKKGTTNLAKDYNLYRMRLAIRFTSNGSPLPIITKGISRTQSFFVSNEVTAGNPLSNQYKHNLTEFVF